MTEGIAVQGIVEVLPVSVHRFLPFLEHSKSYGIRISSLLFLSGDDVIVQVQAYCELCAVKYRVDILRQSPQ